MKLFLERRLNWFEALTLGLLLLTARKLVRVQIFFPNHAETVESIANDTLPLGFFNVPVG